MRILPFLSLLVAACGMPLVAMDKDMAMDKPSPTAAVNAHCPMCSKPIGDNPAKVKMTIGDGADAKTCYMAMDSTMCAQEFAKDPEPYLRKQFGKDAPGAKTPGK